MPRVGIRIVVTSSHGHISINAKSTVSLKAGKSSITLDGSNITFKCPGTFSVKSGMHDFKGAKAKKGKLGALPSGKVQPTPLVEPTATPTLFTQYDEQFVLKDQQTGHVLKNTKYRILDEHGEWHYGITDDLGKTQRYYTDGKVKFTRVELTKDLDTSHLKAPTDPDSFDRFFEVLSERTGKPLVDYPYTITLPSGEEIKGYTDEHGHTQAIASDIQKNVTFGTA